MSQPILEAKNLQKTYGKGDTAFHALKGISLSINPSESLAIVGKSGSGKSTLMHLLALLDKPDSGELKINGINAQELNKAKLNKLRNKTFGFVFQQFFLTPGISVLENVILPLKISGVNTTKRKKIGMEALEQLELADKAKNKATDLSGGQKQRAVIARALVNQPDIIFADEPTGNLDSATSENVENILFSLNKTSNITLILVTHDNDLAAKCDKKLYIRDGLELTNNN